MELLGLKDRSNSFKSHLAIHDTGNDDGVVDNVLGHAIEHVADKRAFIAALDAFRIARKLSSGRQVGPWELM